MSQNNRVVTSLSQGKEQRMDKYPEILDLSSIDLKDSNLEEYVTALRSADIDSVREISIHEFFKGSGYINITEDIPCYEHNKRQWILDEFFKQKEIDLIKTTWYGYLSELPPKKMSIEVSPDEKIKIYKDVMLYYQSGNRKIAVSIQRGMKTKMKMRIFHKNGRFLLMKRISIKVRKLTQIVIF